MSIQLDEVKEFVEAATDEQLLELRDAAAGLIDSMRAADAKTLRAALIGYAAVFNYLWKTA